MGAFDDAIKSLSKMNIEVDRIGDKKAIPIEVIPTGSFGLNAALGINGYPKGRLVELYGKEMSGKSFMSLLAIANVQKQGGRAVLFDVEHAFDPTWAAKLGVDVQNLYVSQPETAEDTLEACVTLAQTGEVDLIVVDSTAAMIPKSELEDPIEKMGIALLARVMSKGLKKLVNAASGGKTCIIFVNQLRDKPGVMFGETTTTPGGRALKFYASIRVEVSVKGKLKVGDDIVGQRVVAKVKKNKLAIPFKSTEFNLLYATGLDIADELVETAIARNIITIDGKTYTFGEQSWVGQEKCRATIMNDPELQKKLMEALK